MSEGRGKPTLPQFLARGDAEVEDEQCDGDGEDSIAERPDPLAAHQSGGSRPIRSPLVIHGIASRALLVVRKSCADNGAMAEPRIVVAHREHLWWLLAEAAQLEHMIMCQYLFAEISLKDSTGEGLTEDQAEAVGRWRKTVRGIAVEEMLHLALVANLMTAIGAAPALGRPNFPQRSGYFPSGLQLDLLPFGERALRHFLYLERPEGMERQDAKGFVPTAPPREPVEADELLPRGQEFATVGHLYRGIARWAARPHRAARRAGCLRGLSPGPGNAGAAPLAAARRGHRPRVGACGRGRDHRAGRGRPRRLAPGPLRQVPRHLGGVPVTAAP